MTRCESRVWLVGACYGLWASVCMIATFAAVALLWGRFWNVERSISGDLIEAVPDTAITAIAAVFGWALVHSRNSQPRPLAYIALAVGIVVTAHIVFVVDMTLKSSGPWPPAPLTALLLGFLFHFWFTIPIAIGATGLFVLCLRSWPRRAVPAPRPGQDRR